MPDQDTTYRDIARSYVKGITPKPPAMTIEIEDLLKRLRSMGVNLKYNSDCVTVGEAIATIRDLVKQLDAR